MNIFFAVPLGPIAVLLLTGHTGAAERLTTVTFFMLVLIILWFMVKEGRETEERW